MNSKEKCMKPYNNRIRALFVLCTVSMLLFLFLLTGCSFREEITVLSKQIRQYTAGDYTDVSTTTYDYDSAGNLVLEVYEDSTSTNTTNYSYDSNGNLLSENNDSGSSNSYMYDSNNNLLSEISSSGFGKTTILYSYDDLGNVSNKKEIYSTEDQRQGFSSSSEDGDTSYTTYTYDEMNRVLTQSTVYTGMDGLRYSFGTTYTYMDTTDLVLSEHYTYSGDIQYLESISYTYDSNGNILTKICVDENGNYASTYTTYTYDENGNILTIDRIGSGSFSTTYGDRGIHYDHYYNDSTGRTTIYRTYDDYGYLLTERTVSSGYSGENSFIGNSIEISYSYDDDHNILSKEEATYNNSGSLLSKTLYTYEYVSFIPSP